MSYVLGYFAADGTMVENRNGGHYIEFHSTDRYLIEATRSAMNSNHKIGIRSPKEGRPRQKKGYRLQIGSKNMFEDLSALGFVQNKSKSLSMPVIPDAYFADFVRGYFDGDGCIYFKRLKYADRKKSRWIVLSMFTSGSRSFLEKLHTDLKMRGVRGGSVKQKEYGYELMFSFKDSLALYELMYNTAPDTGFYLPRKYKLFQRAIRTLYPQMRA